jgi:hypothetical protein
LVAQQNLAVTLGPVISTGQELSKGYAWGFAIEPSFVKSVHEKIDVSAGVVCDIFINNYTDVVRDHLILYGPILASSYKIRIRKISLEPLLGVGYVWGRDFIGDKSNSPTTQGYLSNRVSLLSANGLYGRLGTSIRLSDRIKVGVTYNLYRPDVTVKEEAKKLFPLFNTTLYGDTIEFPSNRMNCNTVLVGFTVSL